MKLDPIFVHDKSGAKGRIVAKHTYQDQPEEGMFAAVKGPTDTTWVPVAELRPATPTEAEAFKKAA